MSAKNNTSGHSGGAFYVGGDGATVTINNIAEADGNAVPSGKYYGGFMYITKATVKIYAGNLGVNSDYKGAGISSNGNLMIKLDSFTYSEGAITGTITDMTE